jgi:hypothetical protein
MRRVIICLICLGIVTGLAALVLLHTQPPIRLTFEQAGIVPAGGFTYSAQIAMTPHWPALLEIRPNIARPGESNAVVTEDGKPLATPHSGRREISDLGRGRYAHVGSPGNSNILFSTSDNSDPRTNGRTYAVVAYPAPSPPVDVLIAALPILILLLLSLLLPAQAVTLGLGGILTAIFVCLFFGRSLVGIDTFHYVTWSSWVPLGYPVFLSTVAHVLGGLRWTAAVQGTLLIAAGTFVVLALARLTRSDATGFIALVVLACDTPLFLWGGMLFSEALFIALLFVNLGAAFILIDGKYRMGAVLLAASAALAPFVRPVGYFVLSGLAFLLIAQRQRTRWILQWIGLPFAAVVLATMLANYGVRGNSAAAQTGRVLFPHVAFLFEPRFASEQNRRYADAVEQILAPRRAAHDKAKDRAARIFYAMQDYNSRLNAMDDGLDRVCFEETVERCTFATREAVYWQFFLATVRHKTGEYVRMVAEGMIEAWRLRIMDAHNSFVQEYTLQANNQALRMDIVRFFDLPVSAEDVTLTPTLAKEYPGKYLELLDSFRVFIRAQRWLIYLVGIVTLLAIPVSLFTQSPHWLALGYCGTIIHGAIILTSIATVFIPRYAVPIDPVVLLAGVIMADGAIRWLMKPARSRMAASRRPAKRQGQSIRFSRATPAGP